MIESERVRTKTESFELAKTLSKSLKPKSLLGFERLGASFSEFGPVFFYLSDFQNRSKLLRLAQTRSDSLKLAQTHSNSPRLAQTRSDSLKLLSASRKPRGSLEEASRKPQGLEEALEEAACASQAPQENLNLRTQPLKEPQGTSRNVNLRASLRDKGTNPLVESGCGEAVHRCCRAGIGAAARA